VIQTINGAGHHIYADRPALFNNIISRTCDMVDEPHTILRPLFPAVRNIHRIGPSMNGGLADGHRTPPTDPDNPVTSES